MKQISVRYFLLLLGGIAFSHALSAQKKLVIIGSSTAFCTGPNHPDSCYVARVNRFYKQQGVLDTTINLAVGGNSIYRAMPWPYNPLLCGSNIMLPDTARNITAALARNPDVILVNMPSNEYDNLTVAQIMCCLRVIKNTANQAGKPCYITTTQPRSSPLSFSTPETRRKMAAIKDSILSEFRSFAIDFWTGIVNPADSSILSMYSAGDGIHLNNAGHAVLAQRVQQSNIFTAQGPLPLHFINFTGYSKKQVIHLTWTTSREENIRNFEVQRSEDGVHFKAIQTVGASNSMQQNQYSSVDNRSPGLFAYYRIAAINNDNKPEFTKVIRIAQHEKPFALERIYFASHSLIAEIQASEKQALEIQVVSNTGQVLAKVHSRVNPGLTSIPVPYQLPGKGVYFIRVSGSTSGSQVKSFMRQ